MTARVLAVVLLASSGCSIFLKGVPDDWEAPADPECQPFIIVPIIDGALGLGIAAWALGNPCQDGAVGCAFGLAGAAALVGAGVYGYLKVNKCRDAQKAAKQATQPAITFSEPPRHTPRPPPRRQPSGPPVSGP